MPLSWRFVCGCQPYGMPLWPCLAWHGVCAVSLAACNQLYDTALNLNHQHHLLPKTEAAMCRRLTLIFDGNALQEQDEGDSSTVHHHFVQQALQPLVEMLLNLLSKQEEGQDEDDGIWNLSLAGGNCLSLVAAVAGDEILALVMPYIQVQPPVCLCS